MIYKELDLIRFIKRQKMYEIAMKLLFTKSDLFLIRNQQKPFVVSDVKSDVESEDSEDWKPKSKHFKPPSNFKQRLLKGVRPDVFNQYPNF